MNPLFFDVAYRLEEVCDGRIELVRQAVSQKFCNGGVLIRCCVSTLSEDYALMASEKNSVHRFLGCPALRRLIPELRPLTPIPDEISLCNLGRYAFEGEIIQLLLTDGCYRQSIFSLATARLAATNFVDAIWRDSNELFGVARVDGIWAEWFEGVGPQLTYCVHVANRWWLICAYDTD